MIQHWSVVQMKARAGALLLAGALLALGSGCGLQTRPGRGSSAVLRGTNAVETAAVSLPQNPVMRGADPHAVLIDGTYWVYPTEESGEPTKLYAYSSTNLQHWTRHGPVLDFAHIPWVWQDGSQEHYAWAPCLARRGDKFYFYYSVGPQRVSPARIGVAVGDSPAGPFIDFGRALLTGGNGFEAIDPMVFADPKTGTHFFYVGGSAGATLRLFELNPDMVSFAREVPVETPPQFTEGAFMHAHAGVYYLSYSFGRWRESSYSVHYATAETPAGPWQYRGALLVSNDQHKGPGHHSIVQLPSGQHLLFYHRWDDRTGDGPYRGGRRVAIEALEYNPEGLLRPVRMTGGRPRPDASAIAGSTEGR
ncbi:MAG TPA: family 43 glycosylhydrolase [Clostridia bacterium]|nr:family 43 glycosylhydrolase [Clostridia bacterium]